MKKYNYQCLCTLLVLALGLAGILPLTKAYGDGLGKEEALEIAYSYIEQNYSVKKEELTVETADFFDNQWGFSLVLKDHPLTTDGRYGMNITNQGEVVNASEPYQYPLRTQVALMMDSSQTLEEMQAFKSQWEPRIDEMLKAGKRDAQEHPQWESLAFFESIAKLLPQIALPGEGDITKDQALEKARAQLAAQEGWGEKKASYFVAQKEVYVAIENGEKAAYQFVFSARGRSQEEMGKGPAAKAFDKYWQEVEEAFGGGSQIPWQIFVQVNAKTGEAVGEPQRLYPEVDLPKYYDLMGFSGQ